MQAVSRRTRWARTVWRAIAVLPAAVACGVIFLAGPDPAQADAAAARAAFQQGLTFFQEAQRYAGNHATDHDGIAERYRRAAESFARAWKAGAGSPEVFTNAANSYAFAGDKGRAVLFYRRALAVDPSCVRARQALEHIRSGLPIRRPQGGAGASILHSLFFWHYGLGFPVRRAAFMALFPLAFILLAVSRVRRRPFFLLGNILLVCSLALLGSLLTDSLGSSLRSDAVILTEVQGRRGDGLAYSPSHSRPFPPATEVTILQRREPRGSRAAAPGKAGGEAWLLVRLLDGKESWIPEGVAERIIP